MSAVLHECIFSDPLDTLHKEDIDRITISQTSINTDKHCINVCLISYDTLTSILLLTRLRCLSVHTHSTKAGGLVCYEVFFLHFKYQNVHILQISLHKLKKCLECYFVHCISKKRCRVKFLVDTGKSGRYLPWHFQIELNCFNDDQNLHYYKNF